MHTLVARISNDAGYDFVAPRTARVRSTCTSARSPDLVILDVMMPGLDGFQVCRRLREQGATEPVIFLSAKGDIVDMGVGFDAGGDDYLVKPFGATSLPCASARICADSNARPPRGQPTWWNTKGFASTCTSAR